MDITVLAADGGEVHKMFALQEIRQKIFGYLSTGSLRIVRAVCQAFEYDVNVLLTDKHIPRIRRDVWYKDLSAIEGVLSTTGHVLKSLDVELPGSETEDLFKEERLLTVLRNGGAGVTAIKLGAEWNWDPLLLCQVLAALPKLRMVKLVLEFEKIESCKLFYQSLNKLDPLNGVTSLELDLTFICACYNEILEKDWRDQRCEVSGALKRMFPNVAECHAVNRRTLECLLEDIGGGFHRLRKFKYDLEGDTSADVLNFLRVNPVLTSVTLSGFGEFKFLDKLTEVLRHHSGTLEKFDVQFLCPAISSSSSNPASSTSSDSEFEQPPVNGIGRQRYRNYLRIMQLREQTRQRRRDDARLQRRNERASVIVYKRFELPSLPRLKSLAVEIISEPTSDRVCLVFEKKDRGIVWETDYPCLERIALYNKRDITCPCCMDVESSEIFFEHFFKGARRGNDAVRHCYFMGKDKESYARMQTFVTELFPKAVTPDVARNFCWAMEDYDDIDESSTAKNATYDLPCIVVDRDIWYWQ